MLALDKPKRKNSQATLKPIPCSAGCGGTAFYRTNSVVLCAQCKVTRRAEQKRRAAETQRRKRGIPKIKGVTVGCALCGTQIILTTRTHKYCVTCAPKAALRRRYEMWAKNPGFRINAMMANAIGASLKGQKAGRRWESLAGYTLADLVRHIERQFLTGMSWETFGAWEIDHIVPLSKFEFKNAEDSDFKAAWALTNLRPLWRSANRRKHATRTHLI